MTRFEKFLLQWIFRRAVRQSAIHKSNIIDIHTVLYHAAAEEFTEDNEPTQRAFMQSCSSVAWDHIYPGKPNEQL